MTGLNRTNVRVYEGTRVQESRGIAECEIRIDSYSNARMLGSRKTQTVVQPPRCKCNASCVG